MAQAIDNVESHVRSVKLLGSEVDLVSLDDTIVRMEEWIDEHDRCRRVVVTGFHGLWEAHNDPEYHRVVNSADLWIPDGIAPVVVAKLRGMRQASRVPGAELMDAFFAKADFAGHSSFFYGDTDATLDRLKSRLEEKYPGHHVAGVFSPPFRQLTADEDEEHVQIINESGADVLWVGLGCPRQDRWIYEHADRLTVPVAVGVGAAFGFLANTIKRSPPWIGRMGMEWAYRLAKEPRKLWRRTLVQGPQFAFHVMAELTGLRKYG